MKNLSIIFTIVILLSFSAFAAPLSLGSSSGVNGIYAKPPVTTGSGTVGPQGPQGPPGVAGINGTNGVNGTNGINGINGTDGSTGPQGPPGVAGINGTNGANLTIINSWWLSNMFYLNFSDGYILDSPDLTGPRGVAGINGTNGINGINGTDGVSFTNYSYFPCVNLTGTAYDLCTLTDTWVNQTGDTMTGPLIINESTVSLRKSAVSTYNWTLKSSCVNPAVCNTGNFELFPSTLVAGNNVNLTGGIFYFTRNPVGGFINNINFAFSSNVSATIDTQSDVLNIPKINTSLFTNRLLIPCNNITGSASDLCTVTSGSGDLSSINAANLTNRSALNNYILSSASNITDENWVNQSGDTMSGLLNFNTPTNNNAIKIYNQGRLAFQNSSPLSISTIYQDAGNLILAVGNGIISLDDTVNISGILSLSTVSGSQYGCSLRWNSTGDIYCNATADTFIEVDPIFTANRTDIWNNIVQLHADNTTLTAGINSKHTPGICPVGSVVMNTTTSGVQCVTPTATVDPSTLSYKVLSNISNISGLIKSAQCSGTDKLTNLTFDGTTWTTVCAADQSGGSTTAPAFVLSSEFNSVNVNVVGNGVCIGAVVGSGTFTLVASRLNAMGTIVLRDSATNPAGANCVTDITAVQINGTEEANFQFKHGTGAAASRYRLGFIDSVAIAQPVDGCYFNVTVNTLFGNCASNNANTPTSSVYTLNPTDWYRGQIVVNPTGKNVTYRIYNMSNPTVKNTLLWENSVITNIPVDSGRQTGFGIMALEASTGAAADIVTMDYMEFKANITNYIVD